MSHEPHATHKNVAVSHELPGAQPAIPQLSPGLPFATHSPSGPQTPIQQKLASGWPGYGRHAQDAAIALAAGLAIGVVAGYLIGGRRTFTFGRVR